jgi:hypothetical protein
MVRPGPLLSTRNAAECRDVSLGSEPAFLMIIAAVKATYEQTITGPHPHYRGIRQSGGRIGTPLRRTGADARPVGA